GRAPRERGGARGAETGPPADASNSGSEAEWARPDAPGYAGGAPSQARPRHSRGHSQYAAATPRRVASGHARRWAGRLPEIHRRLLQAVDRGQEVIAWLLHLIGVSPDFLDHLDDVTFAFQHTKVLWVGLVLLIPAAWFIVSR